MTQPDDASPQDQPRAIPYDGRIVAALLLAPPLLLLPVWLLSWVDIQTAIWTLVGIAAAIAGGLVGGVTAERFLRRGQGSLEQIFGVGATTAVGVVTVGYLYVVHIQGPMASIGTFSRAVEQTLIFLAFLTAQGAGVLLGPRLLSTG
jgi:hypothetical protein